MEYTRKWVGVVGFFLSLWVYDLSMVGISEKSHDEIFRKVEEKGI